MLPVEPDFASARSEEPHLVVVVVVRLDASAGRTEREVPVRIERGPFGKDPLFPVGEVVVQGADFTAIGGDDHGLFEVRRSLGVVVGHDGAMVATGD